MEDLCAPDSSLPQWHEIPDIVRQVAATLCSNVDMFSLELVCKCWRRLGVPYPQTIQMQRLTKLQADWLKRNDGRITSFTLDLAESNQTSTTFTAVLAESLFALSGPKAALHQLTIKQSSKLFNTPRDWELPVLGNLSHLKKLELHCCSMLQMPVSAFAGLSNLTQLQLQSHCLLGLAKMEPLVQLRHLYLNECHKLASIEQISVLTALEHLKIGSCFELVSVPCVGSLSNSLTHLAFTSCPNLATWPTSLSQLRKLQLFEVEDMTSQLSPGLESWTSLTRFMANNSNSFNQFLADAGTWPFLRSLEIRRLIIPELPGHMERLTVLTELTLAQCHELPQLCAGVAGLPKLLRLVLRECSDLALLSVNLPHSLTYLSLTDCPNVQLSEENFLGLTVLQELQLKGCTAKDFFIPETLCDCSALTQLVVKGCHALAELPVGLGKLMALQELSISNCPSLIYLPFGIGSGNSSLRRLLLSECNNLHALPESLTAATALQELELSGLYSKFDWLPDLAAFSALTSLTIRKCSKIRHWPDSLSALVMRDQLKQLILASSPFVSNGVAPEAVVRRLKHFKVFVNPAEPTNLQEKAQIRAWVGDQVQQHAVPEVVLPLGPAAGPAAPGLSPVRTPRCNPFGDAKPVDSSPERYFALKHRMQSAAGSKSPTAAGLGAGSPMGSGTPAGYQSPNRNWSRLQYSTEFLVEAEHTAASPTAGSNPFDAAAADGSGVPLALSDRSTGCYSPQRTHGKGQEMAQFVGDSTGGAGSSSAPATAGLPSQPSTPSRCNPFGDAKPVDASPEKYFANRAHGSSHIQSGAFAGSYTEVLEAFETFNTRSSDSVAGNSSWGSCDGSCNTSAGPSARTSSSVDTVADNLGAALRISGSTLGGTSNNCSSALPNARTSSSSSAENSSAAPARTDSSSVKGNSTITQDTAPNHVGNNGSINGGSTNTDRWKSNSMFGEQPAYTPDGW